MLVFSSRDLAEHWSLSFCDITFVNSLPELAQLGFAAQLKFFAAHGFFVRDPAAIPDEGIFYLAGQLDLSAEALNYYDFSGRTERRHCADILRHLGFRRLKRTDQEQLTSWIAAELCPTGQSVGAMLEQVLLWFRDRRIYGPSRRELERVVRSQRQPYLDSWLTGVYDRLSANTGALLEAQSRIRIVRQGSTR